MSLTGTIDNTNEVQPWINMYMAKNSNAAPQPVVGGDILSGMMVFAFDGSGYERSVSIGARVDPGTTVSTGIIPGEFIAVAQSTTVGYDNPGDSHILSFNSKGRLSVPVIKTGVYDDATARDAFVTVPEKGMIIFNDDTNKFQGYDGSAWVDLN
jgi:hypothetical protein